MKHLRIRLPSNIYIHFIALILASTTSLLHAADSVQPNATRPNILFLLADDWGWPHASCLNDTVVKTPTFDRLVKEGVQFVNAHSTDPSCSPSRASILTGQYPWRLNDGANLFGYLPARFEVYPDLLEKNGYFVGYMLKGYSPGTLGDRTRNPAGNEYKDFETFLKQRPAGQPFCFWLGSHHPHRPYQLGIGVAHGLDPNKVMVPPYLPDSPEIRSDICDYYYNVEYFDQHESAAAVAAVEHLGELDNTIIVMTGDNGWPIPRGKTTNYDTGTHQTLAIRWSARITPGRTVTDFVSLSDLAPTFLDAAGIAIPSAMTAKSLMPLLLAKGSGQIDPTRDHVLAGMERHTDRESDDGTHYQGYPRRDIVTKDYHYIINFHPERWVAGNPKGFQVPGAAPATFEQLSNLTGIAYSDIDASPTKAWIVIHRADPNVKPLADAILGHHPDCELYDLRKDPYELKNVAKDPAYADVVNDLNKRLMDELTATADPRTQAGSVELDTLPSTQSKNPKTNTKAPVIF